jgi:type IV secretion system protein VirD4
MLADPNRDIGELWMEMATYGHVDGQNHPAIGTAARDMMDRPEEEAGSVLSTAKSYLALYRDPVVARNVSKSDFRIKDLMHQRRPGRASTSSPSPTTRPACGRWCASW